MLCVGVDREHDLRLGILRPGKALGQLRAFLVERGQIGITDQRENRVVEGRRRDFDLSAFLQLTVQR